MSNVIDLKTRASIQTQSVTQETSKPEYSETELARFKALSDAIDRETEACDQSWLDGSFEDFGYEDYAVESDDELLKNFTDNYSSNSIGVVEFDHLTADQIRAAIPPDILVNKIRKHSEMEPCDYYIQWNEMGSVQIGETEHQIDVDASIVPDIATALADMTDADIYRFNQWSYYRVSRGHFCVFGHPCERLILKLDPKAFLEDDVIKASLSLTYKD